MIRQLNFKKGDEITLTQKEEGGWWEGTLDGKTGWFPSNYVQEVVRAQEQAPALAGAGGGQQEHQQGGGRRTDYRQQVLKDLLDKEKEFVADLRTAHKKYISPLHRAEM